MHILGSRPSVKIVQRTWRSTSGETVERTDAISDLSPPAASVQCVVTYGTKLAGLFVDWSLLYLLR